jgi:hypothetical protein
MIKKIFFSLILVLFGYIISAQNNVGIGTANPAAKLDVRGNGISYDVLNVSNDKAGPVDSLFVISRRGHVGIGTANNGPYMLKVLDPLIPTGGGSSAFVSQIELWDNDPILAPSRMLADLNNAGAQAGIFSLYSAGVATVRLRAAGSSYLNGGSLGLGTIAPQEKLHLNLLDGAVILGAHVQLAGSEVAGTVEWNGTNFRGFNGTGWLNLDLQQDNDWMIINPSPMGALIPSTYTFASGYVAVSLPGVSPAPFPNNQFGYLYVNNSTMPGTFGHLLLLEDFTGAFDASQGYMITNWQQLGIRQQYSLGIFNPDASFKLTKTGALTQTAQGDGTTMIRANPTGIIDHPNQSRIRAYHEDPSGANQQLIPPNVWTPINFTIDAPLPYGYDQQNEFVLAPAVNTFPAPPENAFFVATVTGYYQVNARCEFNTMNYIEDQNYPGWPGGPVQVGPNSFIAIAIYSGVLGQTAPYAIGNHLQIGYVYQNQGGQMVNGTLQNNNAPNVSDVIYAQAGQVISIWVFHTALTPMNLLQGKTRVYVSIHKVS